MQTVRGSGVVLDNGSAIGSVAYSIRNNLSSTNSDARGHMTGLTSVLRQMFLSPAAQLRLSTGADVPIKVVSVDGDGAHFRLLA